MFCCPLVLISLENTVSNPVFYNIQSSKIYKERMVALVIDEAHCVKTWYAHINLSNINFKTDWDKR